MRTVYTAPHKTADVVEFRDGTFCTRYKNAFGYWRLGTRYQRKDRDRAIHDAIEVDKFNPDGSGRFRPVWQI